MGLYFGCKVYLIHEGYQGMIEGGNYFREGKFASNHVLLVIYAILLSHVEFCLRHYAERGNDNWFVVLYVR